MVNMNVNFRRCVVVNLPKTTSDEMLILHNYLTTIERTISNRNAIYTHGDLLVELVDSQWELDKCWVKDLSQNDWYKENSPKADKTVICGRTAMSKYSLEKLAEFKANKLEIPKLSHQMNIEILKNEGLVFKEMDREEDKEDFYRGVYAKIYML